MKQEMMGGSGISWTMQVICISFQTIMQVPHQSVFTYRMLFLPPNEQCQSTEGKTVKAKGNLSPEARAQMHRKVLVAFLEAIVFPHVVEIVASDDDRSLHFHLHHNTSQDTAANAHVTSEWTFLVNVVTLGGL